MTGTAIVSNKSVSAPREIVTQEPPLLREIVTHSPFVTKDLKTQI